MIKMSILDILKKMKEDGLTNEQILDHLGIQVVKAGIATSDSMWMRSIAGNAKGIVLIERKS